MARFAPIAPLNVLRTMKERGQLGNFHLLLAHEVTKNPGEFHSIFHDVPNLTVIMDNGVVELGEPVTADVMEFACITVPPKYIVLPDVIGDRNKTLELLGKWFSAYKEVANNCGADLIGVIQGEYTSELLKCADVYEDGSWGARIAIGIPRWITKKLGSRMGITAVLAARHNHLKPIHLLGFSDNLMDDMACARIPGVIGIDSSLPVLLGANARSISLDEPQERLYRTPLEEKVWHTLAWTQNMEFNIRSVRQCLGEE